MGKEKRAPKKTPPRTPSPAQPAEEGGRLDETKTQVLRDHVARENPEELGSQKPPSQ